MNPNIQNITLSGDMLTILTGKAPDPFNPSPIAVSGTIEAIKSYVETRYPQKASVRVEYSFDRGFIKLVHNEGSMTQYTVTGQLEVFKDFATILNTHSDPTQLGELLRKKRTYFTDQTEGSKLIYALKGFKAKVDKELEKFEDKRSGHYKNVAEKVVTSNLPESIKMVMEIIKGEKPVEFMVDIYVDVRDNGVSITLESIEAEEFAETIKRSVISDCLENVIRPNGFFHVEV
jgi:hypothetical protein